MIPTRNYSDRLDRLIDRRTQPVQIKMSSMRAAAYDREYYSASPIHEVYNQIENDGKALQYAVGAMQRVDPRYTDQTYAEGDRIKAQLSAVFSTSGINCEFEYQGSVPCDIHIKSFSDIDLLAITDRFVTLEPPQKASNPYQGDPVRDLREIRDATARCFREQFSDSTVDDSGGKSISISGGSLARKVDVVAANWYDTNDFASSSAKRDRGIQILNHLTGERIHNQPFKHAYLIHQKDHHVGGGLRKIVRLMKSLRYDSDGAIQLSSFDLAAIGFGMPDWQLVTTPDRQIALLPRLKEHIDNLWNNPTAREAIFVPDGSRRVFTQGHATIEGLEALKDEVDDLVYAVAKDLDRSFENLAEARLSFKPAERWTRPPHFPIQSRSSVHK